MSSIPFPTIWTPAGQRDARSWNDLIRDLRERITLFTAGKRQKNATRRRNKNASRRRIKNTDAITACCCGSGSTSACANCITTPSRILVTVAGVTLGSGCIPWGASQIRVSGVINGVSDCLLPRDNPTINCFFQDIEPSGPTTIQEFAGDPTCSLAPTGSGSAISIYANLIDDTHVEVIIEVSTDFVLFHGIALLASVRDCSTSVTVNNNYGPGDIGTTDATLGGKLIVASGGTISVSFGGC